MIDWVQTWNGNLINFIDQKIWRYVLNVDNDSNSFKLKVFLFFFLIFHISLEFTLFVTKMKKQTLNFCQLVHPLITE